MHIHVFMHCVDDSEMSLSTQVPETARQWLAKHDHEGSSIAVNISSATDEEVYHILEGLQ